ncbi:hypothetical protein NA57DRAFT_52494 [Rhizodiscina lignyota]|uniref:Ribosomal protein S8 n=1 Tax=Rhizodiscina lignyota TaxID=1504668 RepID=A0A9P4IPC3_9PEZI|nr:hypothetical protein NA57DRAFT_52494 [Rhizodiscina lignyota]
MSLQNLAHVCSHLQNASRGRLGITSISLTKLHLALALCLQKQGFISTVQIGGQKPPEPLRDTILPQDAQTLTYDEYRDLMDLFSENKEARRHMPWHHVPERPKGDINALGSDILYAIHNSSAEQRAASRTSEVRDVDASSPEAPEPTPTPPSIQDGEALPTLSEEQYALKPWMFLYRNASPLPLTSYLTNPSLFTTNTSQRLLSFERWQASQNALAHGHQSSSAAHLALQPWDAYPDPHPFWRSYRAAPNPWALIPANPAQRRLWLGLKYWNNEPVIGSMGLVSKPTRKVTLRLLDLGKLVQGMNAKSEKGVIVRGLNKVGECLFVRTPLGMLEARECVQRRVGGMAMCRVS